MGHFDWDPDELLNFDYGKPIPEKTEREVKRTTESQNKQQVGFNQSEEAQLYAAMRKESEEQRLRAEIDAKMRAQRDYARREQSEAREREIRQAQLRAYQESEKRAQERAREEQERQQRAYEQAQLRAQQEAELRAQQEAQLRAQQEAELHAQQEAELRAQQEAQLRKKQEEELKRKAAIEAYERYRVQSRNDAEKNRASAHDTSAGRSGKASNATMDRYHKWGKILMTIYAISMAAFMASLLIVDVLPLKYLILLAVVLGLLTVFLIYEYKKNNVRKWLRITVMSLTIILTIVYGVGTGYLLGTLSFLSSTSVENEKKVDKITENSFNILMTGMDVTGTIDTQGRSDVNMIVTVNPQTATILMTSIPRDYEIRMPDKGYATDKLTHTGFYSVDTTIGAVDDLLDIETNYYVKVNFTTVKAFINTIGGIDVYSEYEFTPEKAPEWTCHKGWNHMDGRQALGFARERHAFEDGDNQRVKNQQAVLEAMIKKATSGTTILMRYSKMITYLEDYFEMSISSQEMRALMKYQISKNPDWKIYKNKLDGVDAHKTTYTGGSQELYVMAQDPTSVSNAKKLINAVMNGQKLQEDDDGNITVVGEEDSSESESTENE